MWRMGTGLVGNRLVMSVMEFVSVVGWVVVRMEVVIDEGWVSCNGEKEVCGEMGMVWRQIGNGLLLKEG